MEQDEEMDLPTLTGGDKPCKAVNRNGEWHNQNSRPIHRIDCLINEEIVNRVRDLQSCVERKLGGSNEFGGYVKWHWNEGKVIIDDFQIPQQVVGGATVDFRSPADPEYTGVFHKHPTGCKNFSGVDDTYINANHDLSILFEGGNFITGIVNIPLPDGSARYQVKLNIVQYHVTRKEVDVSMISAHTPSDFRGGFTETVRRPTSSLPGLERHPGPIPESLQGDFDNPDSEDDELHFPHLLGD